MKFIKIVSREYGVQYTEMSLRSLRHEAKKHLPSLVLSQFYVPEDKNESCYVDDREWLNFTEALDKKYSSKSNLKKFIKFFHQYGKKYAAVSKKIGGFNPVKTDNENLAKNYKNYQNTLLDYSAYVWMIFLLNNIYAEKANKILNRKKISDNEKIAASLFSPIKQSGVLKLQNRIYSLKNKKRVIPEREIKDLFKKYSWISCLDIHNNPWNKSELDQFVKNLKSVPKIYPFKKAAALAGLSKKEIGYFKSVRELVYIKDLRDEYRRMGIYNILPFFSEMSKRLGVSRKGLAYFSSAEILKALNGVIKLNKIEAAKRQNGFLIYYDKNIRVTSDDNEIKKFIFGKIDNKVFVEDQIKGIVASRGNAKGAVKIILNVKDLLKVKKGDIMVAITTYPDFVPVMYNAQAIITDEGGLTSHAAIVSRELGIPCIVGTKVATKVLKDGDMVEINDNDGVIKIQKKKSNGGVAPKDKRSDLESIFEGRTMVYFGKRLASVYEASLKVMARSKVWERELGAGYKIAITNSLGEHYIDRKSLDKINNIFNTKDIVYAKIYIKKLYSLRDKLTEKIRKNSSCDLTENFIDMMGYFFIIQSVFERIYEKSTSKEQKIIEKWRNDETLFEPLDLYYKIHPEKNEKRIGGWSWIFNNGDLIFHNEDIFFTKNDAKKSELEKNKRGIIETIKGNSAYLGIVRGKVRLCLSILDKNLLKNGEIIVAPMTTVDFIPIMKKAAAFVTDEGGIISHAAIVAREMKKPCIIGTKIASQILKTGDLIEVDANNGVVRILKKKK